MSKNVPIKFIYDDVKITIRVRYDKYYLDFMHNQKRVKRSTGLNANEENLKELKTNIIPELIKALTGNKEIEYFKKDILFTDFAIKFFQVYQGSVREHIFEANCSIYEKQIKPYFSKYNINEIKPIQLEEWQNKLLDKYSLHTVIRYRSILNLILNKAFELENTEIYPFNKDKIIKILNNSTGNLHYFIFIMLCTGMRPGEIISLTWNDIDFEKKNCS